ncbi:MAG: hypothetical protein U0X41_08735 [Chitinophagales bacterium]
MNNKSDTLKWKKFVKENDDLINKAGLPLDYYTNEELWIDFLLHGYIDHHTDYVKFSIDNIANEEYKVFIVLIRKYFESGFQFFNALAIKEENIRNEFTNKFKRKKLFF